jgi:hypothetical protein
VVKMQATGWCPVAFSRIPYAVSRDVLQSTERNEDAAFKERAGGGFSDNRLSQKPHFDATNHSNGRAGWSVARRWRFALARNGVKTFERSTFGV